MGSNKTSAEAAPKPSQDAAQAAKSATPAKAFQGGDQGFLDLKLAEVIPYNHNTKKLRFELPEKDQVSGLTVACKSHHHRMRWKETRADFQLAAAIITKYKGPQHEKPVIRPYTPINDEGMQPYHVLLPVRHSDSR